MNMKLRKAAQEQHDRRTLESTERCQQEPCFNHQGELQPSPFKALVKLPSEPQVLYRPRRCYVCKAHYTHVHHFYHAMCSECAKENEAQRSRQADLAGRVALVTGGRIKIGFEIALRTLYQLKSVFVREGLYRL